MAIVTSITAVADISIAITNPVAVTVPMVTNGMVIKVVTSGTNVPADVDLTKVTMTVTDLGHNTAGAQVSSTRVIAMREHLRGPYAENTYYQTTPGTFHFVLADYIFNQDATWKTTIVSVDFAAGWVPSATVESVASVTRSDTLAYFPFALKAFSHPLDRMATGETYMLEVDAVHPYARNASPLACIEAWGVDSAATVGTVVRQSVFTRSPSTPASGVTVPGLRAETFAAAVSMAGLVQGRVGIRLTAKPWIGPPVSSFSYGDTFPTVNLATEIPVVYDTDGSNAPVYGVLAHDPASPPAGKTVLTVSTSAATGQTAGLSLSIAGAVASNLIYPTLASFLWSVRKFNASAVALVTADGSIKRTVAHDDVSSACAVCPPVAGSVLGANLGAYSIRVNAGAVASFPSGACPVEVRSLSGTPSNDVRWRGVNSEGGSTAAKTIPIHFRARGLTIDSTGVTVVADNIAFDQQGIDTSQPTEALMKCSLRIDTVIREVDPAALTTSVSAAWYRPGFWWDRRVALYDSQSAASFGNVSGNFAGPAASIGSFYSKAHGTGRGQFCVSAVAGWRGYNVSLGGQAAGVAGSGGAPATVQPLITGWLATNVYVETSEVSPVIELIAFNGSRPVRKGAGLRMAFGYSGSATSISGRTFAFGQDGTRLEADCVTIQHLGGDGPNVAVTSSSYADGRINFGYNDQAANRFDRRYILQYCGIRNWNTKGDDFPAATDIVPSSPAFNATDAYYKGAIVASGGISYQAMQDIPASSGILISNAAYWYNSGIATGAIWGRQPLRQGNAGQRYHVGFKGNVGCGTYNGEGITPGVGTPLGLKWGPDEKYNATYANFYASATGTDYRAKSGGDLAGRVAAGNAVAPYFLALDNSAPPLTNSGTDPAGAFASSGISGDSNTTLGAFTIGAAGSLLASGSLTVALAAFTLSGTGTIPARGSLAASLAPFTVSAAGLVGGGAITGSFTVALNPFAFAGSGAVAVRSAASIALDGFAVAGNATVTSAASLDLTFADVRLTATSVLGLITLPTDLLTPVTLAEAKAWLKVDDTDNDDLIGSLIDAARAHIEEGHGIACAPRSHTFMFGCFAPHLELLRGPVRGVTSIAYTDTSNAAQTMLGTGWRLVTRNGVPALTAALGTVWPHAAADSVEVTADIGYASNAAVPRDIKTAALLLIGHWFANREAVNVGNTINAFPLSVDALLRQYRVGVL